MTTKLIPVEFDIHEQRYHCADCGYGWGSYSGEPYHSGRPCPGCGRFGLWCKLPPGHKGEHERGRGGLAGVSLSASCKECGALIFDESGAVVASLPQSDLMGWAAWAKLAFCWALIVLII